MKIVALGNHTTMLGLRLAGIYEVYHPTTKAEASSLLRSLKEREDIGVIVISSDLHNQISGTMKEIRKEVTFPLLVSISTREEQKRI